MPEFAMLGREEAQGRTWRRLQGLSLSTPYGQPPQAVFQQERAIGVGDHVATIYDRSLPVPADPAHAFPVLDPSTGQPSGQTATVGQLTALIYSLYAQLSDAAEAAP